MSLKELIKELEKSNKVADKIGLPYKYYVVVSNHTTRHCIRCSKDLKLLEDYYIKEVAEKLINSELSKEEDYFYSLSITTRDNQYVFTEVYNIQIGVE